MTYAQVHLYFVGLCVTYAFLGCLPLVHPHVPAGRSFKTMMSVSWPVSMLIVLVIGLCQAADERWGK